MKREWAKMKLFSAIKLYPEIADALAGGRGRIVAHPRLRADDRDFTVESGRVRVRGRIGWGESDDMVSIG